MIANPKNILLGLRGHPRGYEMGAFQALIGDLQMVVTLTKGISPSPGSAQQFLSIHAAVYNAFYVQRHLLSRRLFKEFRAETFAVWEQCCFAA